MSRVDRIIADYEGRLANRHIDLGSADPVEMALQQRFARTVQRFDRFVAKWPQVHRNPYGESPSIWQAVYLGERMVAGSVRPVYVEPRLESSYRQTIPNYAKYHLRLHVPAEGQPAVPSGVTMHVASALYIGGESLPTHRPRIEALRDFSSLLTTTIGATRTVDQAAGFMPPEVSELAE